MVYQQNLNKIEADGNNLLGQPVDAKDKEEALLNNSFDLEECYIDTEYIWLGLLEIVSNLDDVKTFLEYAKNSQIETTVHNDNKLYIDPSTLNKAQAQIYDYVIIYYSRILKEKSINSIEPLYAIVMDMAGTSKSYVIKAIRNHILALVQEYRINSEEEPLILVLAPISIVTFNINSHTIHSALQISINFNNIELTFYKNKDMLFEGCSVLFFGDFSQLPPVMDLPIYVLDSRLHDHILEAGCKIYAEFNKAFKLETIQVYTLVLPTEYTTFKNAIRLFTIWDHVDKYNITKLKNLNQPVTKIKAVNSGTGTRNVSPDATNSLEPVLFLSIRAHIMLISNLWTNQGLVNRAMSTVINIIYELGRLLLSLPTVILLKIDNYAGPMLSVLNNNQEFATGLTFVGILWVYTLTDIIFDSVFSFDRLQKLRQSAHLQQRLIKEQKLLSL
ncbi:13222_t:CDS:2 [Cetraspora pellucida]|uniref:13222_t:CDS:1 n=1 Tax=Cetraspora pellucida TaxID=1433469 RepID=A0A9N9HU73_9GLOM|nr:13222_t:CDS:2 [Cetraspora pellucida]